METVHIPVFSATIRPKTPGSAVNLPISFQGNRKWDFFFFPLCSDSEGERLSAWCVLLCCSGQSHAINIHLMTLSMRCICTDLRSELTSFILHLFISLSPNCSRCGALSRRACGKESVWIRSVYTHTDKEEGTRSRTSSPLHYTLSRAPPVSLITTTQHA